MAYTSSGILILKINGGVDMSEDPSHLSQEAMNIFLILEQRMLIASQSNLIYGGCEDANTTIKY